MFKPMLLEEREAPFDDSSWLFEYKWDGFRCLVFIEKEVKLISRNGKNLALSFPQLTEVKTFFPKDTVLDGEIIWGEGKKGSFSKLLGFSKKEENIFLVIFDVLRFSGKNLLTTPLLERKSFLKDLPPPFKIAPYVLEKGRDFFDRAAFENYEGIVAKKISSFYYPGKRTALWLKIKNYTKENFLLTKVFLKQGNVESLMVFDQKTNKSYKIPFWGQNDLLNLLTPIVKEKNPREITLYPLLEVRIQYLEKTPGGLRHPKIVGFSPAKGGNHGFK
ncbi:ATP-dependent DNA ligase [Carboxydothermus ferrireducens]|uniref:ATP-dependent DNA ligase n=1 Tax=Carboxydothermus ferrireducens DSM 11255 TaxID=1119529 RepID=A0ABX2R8R6_9THEO|nr:hypothetical protein [Carboxydothermus ferrireducens]NYE57574.1 ATP-dependent DNA ligase [Carboxydothermus ferrireducens DSM 11255]